MIRFVVIIASIVVTAAALAADIEHVIVIGVDGLGPIGIEKADTPNMDRLIEAGAYSATARGVMPTSSAPNWASMIMGAGPEQHGIIANPPWFPRQPRFDTVDIGPDGRQFPTMFAVLHEQKPELKTAIVYDWDGFLAIIEQKLIDTVINGDKEEDTARQAAQVIAEQRPNLLFVHLDNVDHALHAKGFATEPYFEEVEKADRLIGEILAAADGAGIRERSLIIVTSDHGGNGKNHGGNTNDEITIPWIIQGPGVREGVSLSDTPINTFDTAATVLHILGATPPRAWIARPVLEAFVVASDE